MKQRSGSGLLALAFLRFSGSGLLALALLRFSGCGGGGCRSHARALRAFALCLQQPVRNWFVKQLFITQGSLQLAMRWRLAPRPASASSRSADRFAASSEPNTRLLVWVSWKPVEEPMTL